MSGGQPPRVILSAGDDKARKASHGTHARRNGHRGRPAAEGQDGERRSGQASTTGLPVVVTDAVLNSCNAASVVPVLTPAVSDSSTVVSNPAATASNAVARTQKSVAMPTTSTAVTFRDCNHSVRPCPSSVWPSKPEYAAACSPLWNTASTVSVTRDGWKSAPPVPTTQCAGHESRKSGWSLKCDPGSMW